MAEGNNKSRKFVDWKNIDETRIYFVETTKKFAHF